MEGAVTAALDRTDESAEAWVSGGRHPVLPWKSTDPAVSEGLVPWKDRGCQQIRWEGERSQEGGGLSKKSSQ